MRIISQKRLGEAMYNIIRVLLFLPYHLMLKHLIRQHYRKPENSIFNKEFNCDNIRYWASDLSLNYRLGDK